MNRPAELALNRRPPVREAAVWLGAGLLVLATHAAFAVLLRDINPVSGHNAVEQAMEIDLAPLPVSIPEAAQTETLAQEQPAAESGPIEEIVETVEPEEAPEAQEALEEVPPEDRIEERVAEAVEPEPEPVTEKPESPQPTPENAQSASLDPDLSEVAEPEIVEAVTPEVAIPVPQPRPKRIEERQEEPEAKPVRKKGKVAQEKAKKPETAKEKPPQAAKPRKQASAPAVQASAASTAPKIDPTRWNNAVRAAIARRASAVRGMRGTVRVSFVVDSTGSIVSASVSGSSGNDRLDQAALGMVRSAKVPAPPAGLSGSRHAFAIPLTFR